MIISFDKSCVRLILLLFTSVAVAFLFCSTPITCKDKAASITLQVDAIKTSHDKAAAFIV